MPLLDFPNELLLIVAEELDLNDLNSFLQTNRRLACVVGSLFEKFAVQDKDGCNALSWAILGEHLGLVEFLLAKCHVDLNQKDCAGQTALHCATKHNCKKCHRVVRLLLDRGACTSIQDNSGLAPLHRAVMSNNIIATKILLEEGVDVNIQDTYGRTALHLAAMAGGKEILSILLEKGADVHIQAINRATALHYAAGKRSVDNIKILLESGADISAIQHDRKGVLHLAAATGSAKTILFFLRKNTDVTAQDMDGSTPLHWAAKYGHKETFRILLQNGADAAIRDSRGRTVSSWASYPEIAAVLVEAGITTKNTDQQRFSNSQR